MKKCTALFIGIVILFNMGCGTICGGRIDSCMTTKGVSGTPQREVRPAALIFDVFPVVGGVILLAAGTFPFGFILAPIYLGIDAATGGLYRPCSYYPNPKPGTDYPSPKQGTDYPSPNNNNNAVQYVDVVYLKNGSIIRGIIIEQVPNVSLKIQTKDGSVYFYKMDEVEKMTKEPVK